MKNKIWIFITLLFLFTSNLFAQITVVVADFKNESDEFHLDSWERSVPALIRSEISQSDDIVVLERDKLEAVFEEQKLYLTGFIDSSKVQQVGKLLGAQFIISGRIHKIDKHYRIDVDIIRIKTAQVKTEKAEAPDSKHLKEMTSLLSNNIKYHLTGKGSYKERISISGYPTKYFLGATVGFGVAAYFTNKSYVDNLDKYDQNNKLDEFDTYYDKANNARKLTIVMASLAASALAGTIYCLIRNRTTDAITAYPKTKVNIKPALGFNLNREVQLSVQIHF